MLWSDSLCPHPTIHLLKSQPPKSDGVRRWAHWRCSDHEGGALVSEINAHIKDSRELPSPSLSQVCWLQARKTASAEHNCAGNLILDFPASRMVSNKFQISVASKPPRQCYFTTGAQMDLVRRMRKIQPLQEQDTIRNSSDS